MSRQPAIKIMCAAKGCSRELATITQFPAEGDPRWTDRDHPVWVESCKDHGGIPKTIQDADELREGKGLPPVERSRLMHGIPWADLRIDYLRARKTGRVVRHNVKPLGRL